MNLVEEINKLKKEKNAIILAHFYQPDEIQDIADYLGDSLKLSQIASESDADVIVFAGVSFMAETAKILCPNKHVYLPAKNAGCRMTRFINAKSLSKYKEEHPDTKILMYVNSEADVKALADCCVTSSNAMKIIKHYLDNNEKIMYCPDQNLAKYAMKQMNTTFECWPGCCITHHQLSKDDIIEIKNKHKNAIVLAHPECNLEVLSLADYVGSTKGIINYATESDKTEFIIATEKGILHELSKKNPNKKFYLASPKLVCPNMKKTTLEQIYACLHDGVNEVFVDDEIAVNAKKSLDKMMELSKE
ncbi:MAG: quinolinate synthase NadA [Acholeplasmatales bacterium]|nr:quinolinate synthase NadA [Acholeplasmatales bacterium]